MEKSKQVLLVCEELASGFLAHGNFHHINTIIVQELAGQIFLLH